MTPEEFETVLRRAGDHMEKGSFEEPLRECLPTLHQGYEDNFIRAEDSDGVPWPPHAPATVARMGPHPLLIWHGPLIEAVRDTGNPGNITEIKDDGRTLETGVDTDVVEYAATHQYGEGDGRIPQREYLYANEQTVDDCEDVLAEAARQDIFGF